MVNKELLDKVMTLYLDSNGVIVRKHNNKSIKIYETDSTRIDFSSDVISFEFDEGYFKGFKIHVKDITDIQFDIDEFVTISNIILNNKKVISLHTI